MQSVLYLTNQLPYPPRSGGQIRAAELLPRVSNAFQLHLVAVGDSPSTTGAVDAALEHGCASVTSIDATATRPPAPPPDVPERVWCYDASDASRRIASLLSQAQPVLAHVEGYFLMHHVRSAQRLPVFLVEQNIEYRLVEQQEELGRARGAGWKATREVEQACWRAATMCGAVTDEDASRMRADVPGLVVRRVPNGWDHDIGLTLDAPNCDADGPLIVFAGSYDWAPSRDAAELLLEELWPRIRCAEPAAKLMLVGAGGDGSLRDLAAQEGVRFVGEVPALGPYLRNATVFLCPLRFGGGVKVKVVEALRSGCAVVTTPVGVEGLPARLRGAVKVEPDWRNLSDATIDLLRDPPLLELLRRRAREGAADLTTWDRAAESLAAAWEEAISRGAT